MAVLVFQAPSIESSGAVASLSKAFTSNITAGDAVFAGVMSDGGKATGAGIFSDNNGGSYTRIVQNGGDVALGRALNHNTGATTVTYTPDSGNDYCALALAEVYGLHTAPDDGSNTRSETTSTPRTDVVTTTANGIIFGAFSRHFAGTTTNSTDGHTDIFSRSTYVSVNGAIGYHIVSAGSNEMIWDNVGSALAVKAAIMALKEAAAFTPPPGKILTQAVKTASIY